MDTQQILSSLASLRENLSAIETARQQVQNNVAAYDKVRQQLADTSTDVSKILDDFTSLMSEIEGYQASISTNIEETTSDILKSLKKKANVISNESTIVVEALRTSLASVQSEIKTATDDTIKRIEANTVQTNQNLDNLLQESNSQFVASTEKIVKSFAKEIEKFQKQVNNLSEKFDKSLSAQLGRLATSVNDHIGKYESLNQELKNQIADLKSINDELKAVIATLETSISNKIDEILPNLSSLIDGVVTEIGKSKAEVKEEIDSAYQKVKTDLKGSHDATRKRIEKFDDRLSSNHNKTLSAIENSGKSFHDKIEEVKSQNGSTRTLMLIGFVIIALPILLMFARMFKFI